MPKPRSTFYDTHRLGVVILQNMLVMHVNTDCLTISPAEAATAIEGQLIDGVTIRQNGHLAIVFDKKNEGRVRAHVVSKLSKYMTDED